MRSAVYTVVLPAELRQACRLQEGAPGNKHGATGTWARKAERGDPLFMPIEVLSAGL